jgi:hypothetical protein
MRDASAKKSCASFSQFCDLYGIMESTEIVVPDILPFTTTYSSELVKLCLVPLQGVDLATTDEDKVRALLDSFPRALRCCRAFHHVVCAAWTKRLAAPRASAATGAMSLIWIVDLLRPGVERPSCYLLSLIPYPEE